MVTEGRHHLGCQSHVVPVFDQMIARTVKNNSTLPQGLSISKTAS